MKGVKLRRGKKNVLSDEVRNTIAAENTDFFVRLIFSTKCCLSICRFMIEESEINYFSSFDHCFRTILSENVKGVECWCKS